MVSAEYGPLTFIPFFFLILITEGIIFSSSLNLEILSQCGFNPVTAIFA